MNQFFIRFFIIYIYVCVYLSDMYISFKKPRLLISWIDYSLNYQSDTYQSFFPSLFLFVSLSLLDPSSLPYISLVVNKTEFTVLSFLSPFFY